MLQDDHYCPGCGSPLVAREVEGRRRPVCSQCGRIIYYDPKITAAAIVEQDGRVLLVQRATEPGIGLWSLPGGYADRGEVVEQAAAREVVEETGLRVEVGRLVGLYSEAEQTVVLAAYEAHLVGGDMKAGHEVSRVDFFPPDDLPPLAFPRDRQVLEAWRRLRSKG